jgi:hypothetical protein
MNCSTDNTNSGNCPLGPNTSTLEPKAKQ